MTTDPVKTGLRSLEKQSYTTDSNGDVVLRTAGGILNESGSIIGFSMANGKPRVSTSPYLYDIAEGNIADHQAFRRIAQNTNVGTSPETVWNAGGLYVYPTVSETVGLFSTDAADHPTGSGLHTVRVQGLDSSYSVTNETVTLSGVSTVSTTKEFIRVLKMRGRTVGASGSNVGAITCSGNDSGYTLSTIVAGQGQSHDGLWTVPSGSVAYLTQWGGSENSSKGSEVTLWVREPGMTWELYRIKLLLDSLFMDEFKAPLTLSEMSDVELRADGVLAGANVNATFEGWFESV